MLYLWCVQLYTEILCHLFCQCHLNGPSRHRLLFLVSSPRRPDNPWTCSDHSCKPVREMHKLTSADVVSLHLHFVQHMLAVLTSAMGSSTSRHKTDGLFSCKGQWFVELTSSGRTYSNYGDQCFTAGSQKAGLRQTTLAMNSVIGC